MFIRRQCRFKGTKLSEQSADEGKTDNIAHLNSEAHSTTRAVTLRSVCLRGEGSTARTGESAGEKY